VLGRV
jgi:DNA-binding NarL/FixJ family response regulator